MKQVLRSFKEVFHLPNDWQTESESADTISQWFPYREKTEMRVGRVSSLAFSLMLALGTAVIAVPAHASNIQADKSAPQNQQPIVAQTANGLPQVNIQTPTSAGVSVNQYRQFDVDDKGAILNNSRRNAQTQQGGWIQGNPFLATGEARVIVNQVNSANPSLLNGYIEVGGQRAEVVLANPAGIQVNGGGFINTSSATLTTGTPFIRSGQLDSYLVRDGQISIKGKGLNAKDTDFTRILSRYVEADAPVWANELQVVAGSNDVAANGAVSAQSSNTAPSKAVAIDTGELGGMYANKIMLVSTESGAKVNHAGQMFAQAGGVQIDANGQLSNKGTIASQGQTEIKAQQVDNSGTLSSKEAFHLKTNQLDNSGTILSAHELNTRVSGSLNNQATGRIQAARIDVESHTLDNKGTISQTGLQGLALESAGTFSNSGKIGYPEADSSPTTGNSSGATGTSASAQSQATPSTATGSGSVVNTPITVPNFATGSLKTSNTLNNSGVIQANAGIDLTANHGLSNTSELNLNRLTVSGDVLDNQNAKINAQSTHIKTNTVNNQKGELTTSQTLNITTKTLDNRAGKLQSVNQANLAISDSLNNQDGEIAANNELNIHDQQAKTLHIDNTDGSLIANQVSLQSKSLNNQGKLAAGQKLSIDLKDDFKVERDLEAGSQLSIQTQGHLGNTHQITAGESVQLQSAQNMTNRGTINSNGLTHVKAGQELLNIGTGKIYGNHVALSADSVVNRDENQTAAVVAARGRLDIGAREIINKTETFLPSNVESYSKLHSEGTLALGGTLNAQHQASGKATNIINGSALISSAEDMSIETQALKNQNLHFTSVVREIAGFRQNITEYEPLNSSVKYDSSRVTGWGDADAVYLDGNKYEDYTRFNYTRYKTQHEVENSAPAMITSGGTLTLDGVDVLNDKSQVLINGINVKGNAFKHIDAEGEQRIKVENGSQQFHEVGWNKFGTSHKSKWGIKNPYAPEDVVSPIKLGVFKYDPAHQGGNQHTINAEIATVNAQTGNIKTLNNPKITLPNNNLYTINPANSSWLIETDPAFANYRQWLGSDYMLATLKTDPSQTHKRLGDGYYEQKLVNEQINRLTGFRRLDGYASDEDQFKALMNSGVTAAHSLGLTLGISLSAEQVARLTSDIVWLETQTITLADGSTQSVLVPKVYVVAKKGDLDASGALISADKIRLNISHGVIQNGGTIGARQVLAINARDIENSGHLQAPQMSLKAEDNLTFQGGTAQVDSLFSAQAKNVNMASTTSTSGDKSSGNTVIGRIAGIYVRGDEQGKGILAVNAEQDLNLKGMVLSNTASNGLTQLVAENDVNIGTVRTGNHESYGELSDKNHRHVHQTAEVGTQIKTKGNVIVSSGKDINIRQGDMDSADGKIYLSAKNDINITEGRQTLDMDVSVHTKSNNIVSRTQSLNQFQTSTDEAVGSTITGNKVVASAGGDLLVRGSQIVSDDGTYVKALGNVSVMAAQNHHTDSTFSENSKSGLMGSGGIGFTIGNKKTANDNDSTSLTHTASTIGSLKGDTQISAGKHYEQHGSIVSSVQGNNYIEAQSVNVTAAENRYTNDQAQTHQQKGLTVAVNVPAVNLVQGAMTIADTAKQVGQSKNDRVNAMAAANTAWQTYQTAQNAADMLKSGNPTVVSATLTYGEQRNHSENHQDRTEAQASQILSGGKTYITATGAGKDSDINITGSDVAGKAGTILIADNDITLQSAEQHSIERSNNTSSGWNAGVKVAYENGSPVLGITAGGNLGKGHGNGDSITHRHSHIGDKGSRTLIQSGGNSTIKGAQVMGKGVQVDAQNLTIQSVQESESYRSRQQNGSAQVTVGYGASASGNYSQSKINAEHQSVSEQSGIYAGDEGYQIHIAQHTDLKGGLITSSQSAEDKGKNRFSTGTLTTSDIKNHSQYEGESFGIGTDGNVKGGWTGKAKDGLSASLGYGNDSDKQSSITKSGINTQNIQIKDEAAQIQLTGKTAEETQAQIHTDTTTETAQELSGSLKNVFDKDRVQSELDLQRTVSQDFSQTSQQAGTEINRKAKEHNDKAEQLGQAAAKADAEGNQELAQALAAQAGDERKKAASWQRGGVLLNMISAGLSAPTQSTTGMVAATASPALSYEIGQHFKGLAKENQRTGKTEQEELSTGQKTAHILAHAILGAAVAAAGDNNALAGALSAGGAEAASPYISKWLYGKEKGSDLTEEEKETVSAITNLLGTATGAVIGDTTANAAQGSLNAQNAVRNNWLTKEEVDKLLIAEEGCKNGAGIEQACLERDRLKALDAQRDFQVLVACRNLKSQQCIDMKNQLAIIMGYIPAGYGQSRLYGLNQVQRDAYNKEYASIDTLIKLASGYTPEQIARDTKLHHAAVRLLTDLSIAGTVRDFKEADTLTDIAIAAIFAAPGLKQIEALRYAGDFRKAYQAAKEAGDLGAAKEILELARQAQKSPNYLSKLKIAEQNIHNAMSIQFNSRQLDRKFKHAIDFGITTTKKNPETLKQFQTALQSHLKDSNTIQQGVYGANKDIIYFNPKTFRFVAVDKVGNFVTGWKLDPNSNQYINYIKNGFIK